MFGSKAILSLRLRCLFHQFITNLNKTHFFYRAIVSPEKLLLSNVHSKVLFLRLHSHATNRVCWNCSQSLQSSILFCNICKCLQPIDKNSNFFKTMDIECSFKINLQELKLKFRNLQSLLHPDKFSSKSKVRYYFHCLVVSFNKYIM